MDMRNFLALLFYLIFSALAAQAGFFDNFFGNLFGTNNGDPAVSPYSISVCDISTDAGVISKTPKTLKLKIYYPTADLTKISALSTIQLNSALDEALKVVSKDAVTDVETPVTGLNFSLRFKQVTSTYKDTLEIQYHSQGITLDTVQQLRFTFNSKQFLRLLNVSSTLKSNTSIAKLFVKPIIIDLQNPMLDGLVSVNDSNGLDGYAIFALFNDTLSDPINVVIDNGDLAFTYKVNGVSKIASAKSSPLAKPISLEVEGTDPSVAISSETSSLRTYQLTVPLSISTTQGFTAATTYKLRVPLELETQTRSGLKVLLRGIAKGNITIP